MIIGKMYRLPADPVEKLILPEGYTVSNYKTEDDKLAWCEICKNGLVDDDAGKEKFDECITSNSDIKLNEDVFFIDHNGEHIGTITAYHDTKENIGQVHMVGIRTDYRGRGLGKYLNNIAIQHLEKKPVRFFRLTTDEWRKGAVKSYLTAGFIPVKVIDFFEVDCLKSYLFVDSLYTYTLYEVALLTLSHFREIVESDCPFTFNFFT